MHTPLRRLATYIAFTFAIAGCSLGSGPEEHPDGPFGKGDSPYADSEFHDCARTALLTLVNDPGNDATALATAGLSTEVAARVISRRPFSNVQAVETVPGVGLQNVRTLLRAVSAQCAGYSFARPCESATDSDADGDTDRRSVSTFDDYGRRARQEVWRNGAISRVFLRTFDEAGNYVRMEQRMPDASGVLQPTYISERTYDERGRKTRELEDKSGDGQWQVQHDWTYGEGNEPATYAGRTYGAANPGTTAQFDYNGDGTLKQERWYMDDKSGADWFERRSFEYTSRGMLSREVVDARAFDETFTTETKLSYTSGGLQQSSETYVDGALETGSYFAYDAEDRLSRQEEKEGDVLVQTISYIYDARGTIIREEHDGATDRNQSGTADGTIDEITEFRHDAARNLVSTETRAAATGQATSRTSYDYGCWTPL